MLTLVKLTLSSIKNRKLSFGLTLASIAISVVLLFGVETIRNEARSSFVSSVSGTDLIVGAPAGQVQLLLTSVFRIGNASSNMSWQAFEFLQQHPSVNWSVPISLGDSHRGYPVLATNDDYFRYFRFANKQPLQLSEGDLFTHDHALVLGADIAKTLGYTINDKVILAHGSSHTRFTEHKDSPFTVTGILRPTGTPVDRTLHISLEGLEAMHANFGNAPQRASFTATRPVEKIESKGQDHQDDDHAHAPHHAHDSHHEHQTHDEHDHSHDHNNDTEHANHLHEHHPNAITAAFVGLKSRIATLQLQRQINEYKDEPLQAIMPRMALATLWKMLDSFEQVLLLISALVVIAGLIGMLTSILSTLNERRREMAILRSVGARPVHVFMLFIIEGMLTALAGVILGWGLLFVLLTMGNDVIAEYAGFYISGFSLGAWQWMMLGIIVMIAALLSAIPALIAYRHSLQDGLTVRM